VIELIWIQITLLLVLYIISFSQLFYITSNLFKRDIKGKVDFILSKKNYRIIPPIYITLITILPLMPQPRIEPIIGFHVFGIMQFDIVLFLIGTFLFTIGTIIEILTFRVNKLAFGGRSERIYSESIYGKMRHPMYSAFIPYYLGLGLIHGSVYSILLFPFILIVLKIWVYQEEKYALIPQFGEKYLEYKSSTPKFLSKSIWLIVMGSCVVVIIYIFLGKFPWLLNTDALWPFLFA